MPVLVVPPRHRSFAFGNSPALMKKFVIHALVMVTVACFAHRSGGQGMQYAPLELFTNGPGRITPLHAGQMLEVWQTYNMVATPDT